MRPKLPEKTREEVITLWLLGFPRDQIASNLNISGGSVTNTVENWKEHLDKGEADALRVLGKSIRASGLSPSEYAAGTRITNLLAKNQVNIEKAEQFLTSAYKRCENLRITPEEVVSHIEDLAIFSDKIRLPEIEQYIKQRIDEKEELDKQISEKEEEVSSLRHEIEELQERRDRAFEEQRKAGDDFDLFVKEKDELERLDLTISDTQKFASAVKELAEHGYQPDWIIAKTDEMRDFNLQREALKFSIYEATKKYNSLNQP
jgi:chromosome segregation ATPase